MKDIFEIFPYGLLVRGLFSAFIILQKLNEHQIKSIHIFLIQSHKSSQLLEY